MLGDIDIMEISTNAFASKIEEFKVQYQRMQMECDENRTFNRQRLEIQINKLQSMLKEEEENMQTIIKNSSSEALVAMSHLQKYYESKMQEILENKLALYMHFKKNNSLKQMEESALYAEYAMDYAIHSMHLAMLSIFLAMEKELNYQEEIGGE